MKRILQPASRGGDRARPRRTADEKRGPLGSKTVFALAAVALMLLSVFAGMGVGVDEVDGDTGYYWTYTITPNGAVTGSGVDRNGNPIASNPSAIGPGSTGSYVSSGGENIGSWGFDSAGYGPFGSFYAAFDADDGNRMICHLNPNDLKRSVDGTISVDPTDPTSSYYGKAVNIMWCLPTVYWKTDGDGNLILTNDRDAGGTAYAHTVYDAEGVDHTYEYIAIGVYEAATATVGGQTILTSQSDAKAPGKAEGGDTKVLVNQKRATMRGYANAQTVSADGTSGGAAMLWNFYQYELYKYCALATMGSWDSQGVAGGGYVYKNPDVSGEKSGMGTGTMDASGPYAGTVGGHLADNYMHGVKLFIENPWGSLHTFVDGILFSELAYVIDQRAVPKDTTRQTTGITILTDTLPYAPEHGYWGSSPSTTEQIWGMPTATSGTSASGLYDMIGANIGTRTLCVGGYSYGGPSSRLDYGLSYIYALDKTSVTYASIGGRLAFVFDADPAPTFSVQYDADGGSPQIPSAGVQSGQGYTISDTRPQKEGFAFIGWSYGAETYDPGDTIQEVRENITLTGVWGHTVTFDLGGGTWNLEDTVATGSGQYTLPTETPTRDGSTFMGWRNGDDAVSPGGSIGLDSNITLTGVWGHTVTFDLGGGTWNLEDTVATGSGQYTLPTETPTRDGSTFMGWRNGDDAVSPGGSIGLDSNITLTGVWGHTVTFDLGGGTWSLQDTVEAEEGTYTLPTETPTRDGCTFKEWRNGDDAVLPGGSIQLGSDTTLTAVWEGDSEPTPTPRPLPIIPDDGTADGNHPVVIVPETEKQPWLWKNGETFLIIAIIATIIAELAILTISRRR